jgi:hypothetical protein
MFTVDAFRKTLEKLIDLLETHGIKFHLTGGVANIVYGEPRMTQDIDIVVDNQSLKKNLTAFVQSLNGSDFIYDEEAVHRAIKDKRIFQLLDSLETLKLGIYTRELIPGELNRSEKIELFEGMFVPIASLVDTAVAKLIWIDKGSHKSRRDLRQLMRISTETQRRAIKRMATEVGLEKLLSKVLSEIDEIDIS